MDYFSFLGIGGKEGYKQVAFSYENDLFFTRFVQEFVLKKHENQINRLFVFFTKESWEKYGSDFKEMVKKYDIKFQKKIIDQNISSEKFVEILKDQIQSESVVIDITHSFRNMTIKFLFMLRYIEKSKGVNIKHIYYGKLEKNGEESTLEDFVSDYRKQELGEALSLFENTLFIDINVIDKLKTKDQKLFNLINNMSSMNLKMETSDLEGSLKSCKNICDSCKSIIRDEKIEYVIIKPFVRSIYEKFKVIEDEKNDCYKSIKLIELFISHRRTQAAITFIDQLFRNEIINCCVNDRVVANNKEDNYLLSQRIMYGIAYLNLNNSRNDNNIVGFDQHIEIDIDIKNIVQNNALTINSFYSEVRNKVNHGQAVEINKANSLNESMLKVIKVIHERGGKNG